MNSHIRQSTLSAALIAATSTSILAAPDTWNAAIPGNWTDPTKWSAGLPGSVSDAVIAATGSPYTVTLNSDVTVNSVTLGGASQLSIVPNSASTTEDVTLGRVNLGGQGLLLGYGNLSDGGPLPPGIVLHNSSIIGPGTLYAVSNNTSYLYTAVPVLDGVTLGGGVSANFSLVNITNNLSLAGNATLLGTVQCISNEAITGNGTLTFSPSTGNLGSSYISIGYGNTLLVDKNVTLAGALSTSGSGQFSTLVNNGTITTSNQSLYLNLTTITNNGSIILTNGASGGIFGNITNVGNITVDATSSLTLGGTYTPGQVLALQLHGGNLTLSGTLNNANSVLPLDLINANVTASLTISGGTVMTSNNVSMSGNFTLNNVTLGPSSTPLLKVTAGLSEIAPATLTNTTIGLVGGNGTLADSVPFLGNGTLLVGGASNITNSNANGVIYGTGLTIRTGTATSGINPDAHFISNTSITNAGLISAETPQSAITLQAPQIFNSGVIQAINGGMVIVKGNLNNSATINNTGGVLVLETTSFSPTFFASFGNQGVVALGGYASNYNNTNSTFTISTATGALGFTDSATLTGGTLTSPDNTPVHILGLVNTTSADYMSPSAKFSNVTLGTTLIIHQNADLNINGNLMLSGATIQIGGTGETIGSDAGSLSYTGTGAILGTGTIILDSSQAQLDSSNGTLTISSGIVVETGPTGGLIGRRSGFYDAENFINQGMILSQSAGGPLSFNVGSFLNQGSIAAANGGGLSITGQLTNSGNITAQNMPVTLNGTLVNTGNVSLQNCTLTVSGYSSSYVFGNFTHTGSTTILDAENLSMPLDLAITPFGPASLAPNSSLSNLTLSNSAGAIDLTTSPNTWSINLASPLILEPGVIIPGNGISLLNTSITLKSSAVLSSGLVLSLAGNGTVAFYDITPGAQPGTFSGYVGAGVTLSSAQGSGNLTLNNVTMQGTIVASAHLFTINNGFPKAFTNAGLILATGGTINIYGNLTNTGSLSASSGVVDMLGPPPQYTQNISLINSGNISSTGGSIFLYGNVTNSGSISVSNGGVISLGTSVTGNGSISVNNGTLVVPTLTLPTGSYSRSGGTVALSTGFAGNPGAYSSNTTTAIDLATSQWGPIDLDGAGFSNVTLTSSSGGRQIINPDHPGNTSVTNIRYTNLRTSLTINPGSSLSLQYATLNNSTLDLDSSSNSNANLTISGTIIGNGTVLLDGNSSNNHLTLAASSSNGSITVMTGTAGTTLLAPATWYGLISAQTLGAPITLSSILSVGATGTIQAINGGAIVSSANLAVSGTINIDAQSFMTFSTGVNFVSASANLIGLGTLNTGSVAGYLKVPGKVNVTGSAVNVLKSLTISGSTGAWTGLLNLGSTDLVLRSSTGDPTPLMDQVRQGYDGGDWLGTGGITSATAEISSVSLPHFGLAVLTGQTYTATTGNSTFDNQTIASTDILLKLAVEGDANLDGRVDLSDLNTVLNNLGTANTSWIAGNFDYAPTIDLTDLNDVLNALGYGAASPTITSTPEPASLALIGLATPLALLRRRAKV